MRTLIAVALLLALDGVPAASAPDAPAIKVKGRSLARVDLDAGRAEGLKVGDRLRVITGQTTVAEIQIVHVDEHTAYCKVVSLTRPIGIGDVAVPVARASGPPAPAPHAREAVAAAPPTGPPTPSVASKTEPAATAAPPATPQTAAGAPPPPPPPPQGRGGRRPVARGTGASRADLDAAGGRVQSPGGRRLVDRHATASRAHRLIARRARGSQSILGAAGLGGLGPQGLERVAASSHRPRPRGLGRRIPRGHGPEEAAVSAGSGGPAGLQGQEPLLCQ